MKQQNLLELEHEKNFKSTGIDAKHAVGTQTTRLTKRAMVAAYDFSVQGGAIGVINLKNPLGTDAVLPKGAVITNCIIDVITAPTSGGAATIAVGTDQAVAGLKAATAIASYTVSLIAGIPVGTAATSIKMTADRTLSITVATAALTAGKMNVLVEYFVSI